MSDNNNNSKFMKKNTNILRHLSLKDICLIEMNIAGTSILQNTVVQGLKLSV